MGNWYDDIDYALEETIRTKLSQVIDELEKEYYLNIDTKNDVYHYFKNSKKTGIIDRAEKYLGLRFDELQAINEKEKSDALSLAKYLYLVEMNYPLLKGMSNPSLAQTTIYGEKSGNEDEDIVAIIAEKIKTRTTPGFADRSDSCYYEMLNDWLYIRSELTNCIIEKLLSGRSSKAEFEQLYFLEKMKDMIQEGVPVELKDADMRFALKHLKTVAEWWMPDKLDDNYINVIAAITVMQELAYLYNTKLKYTYQYNKHDDPKPFSAIISKPDKADEMFKSVMTERLNERFMANIGGDVWSKLHTIRESICSIIDVLISYANVDDAQMASYALYGYAENVLKSVSVPQSTAELFIEAINANITCGVSVEAIEENCYLTRLLHEKEYDLLNAAAKIAKEWDKYALQGQMFIAIVNVGYSVSVKILADTSKGKIQILKLWNKMKPYELNKLSKLGLGEIFNE